MSYPVARARFCFLLGFFALRVLKETWLSKNPVRRQLSAGSDAVRRQLSKLCFSSPKRSLSVHGARKKTDFDFPGRSGTHFVPSMPAFRPVGHARSRPPDGCKRKIRLVDTPAGSGLEVDGQASGPRPARVFGYLASVHEALEQGHRHLHACR